MRFSCVASRSVPILPDASEEQLDPSDVRLDTADVRRRVARNVSHNIPTRLDALLMPHGAAKTDWQ